MKKSRCSVHGKDFETECPVCAAEAKKPSAKELSKQDPATLVLEVIETLERINGTVLSFSGESLTAEIAKLKVVEARVAEKPRKKTSKS